MAGTPKRIAGPAYLANSAADIYTPPASTMYVVIRQIHICNVTTAAATFSLYVGSTGGSSGGTELFKDYNVNAKGTYDWYGYLVMKSTDFLSGLASASSTLTITVMADQLVTP